MALSATSKAQLAALLSPLSQKDPATIDALTSVANRLLSSTDRTRLLQIMPTDGSSGTPIPAGAAAVVTLLADIAAN